MDSLVNLREAFDSIRKDVLLAHAEEVTRLKAKVAHLTIGFYTKDLELHALPGFH